MKLATPKMPQVPRPGLVFLMAAGPSRPSNLRGGVGIRTRTLNTSISASGLQGAEEPHGYHEPSDGLQWIAGGSGDELVATKLNITNFAPSTGTATFNGGAVGRYVLRNRSVGGRRTGSAPLRPKLPSRLRSTDFVNDMLEWDGLTEFREGGTSFGRLEWSISLGSSATAAAPLTATGVTCQRCRGNTPRSAASRLQGDWAATLHGSNNPGYMDIGDGHGSGRNHLPGERRLFGDRSGWRGRLVRRLLRNHNNGAPTDRLTTSNAAIAGAFAAAP